MWFLKKTSPRRSQVREKKTIERLSQINQLASTDHLISALLVLLFAVFFTIIISLELILQTSYLDMIPRAVIAMLLSLGAAFYIHHYQKRLIKNHTRAVVLAGLFIILSATTKLGLFISHQPSWATGTAITAAIILAIAYDQRFAIGMSIFYCFLAYFAARPTSNINLFLTMTAGAFTCCLFLKEIRTRMRLLEVTVLAAAIVFVTSASLDAFAENPQVGIILGSAGRHAGITLVVGVLIQGLLPIIEKIFRIATSMTLLDYSDANQLLLKRLAMEAPGTFSHSLLVGSIAEAAAEAVGRNGLLCRVGAYYHDIGKINKPAYFAENETASMSRHKELSPAMSQLIIVGHVKDGIEMAREYNLPAVLRQFIETHHGTTLIEYFYNEARKKHDENDSDGSPGPSESEFRYAGPKPRTKEAAIVMLADAVEGAVRALPEVIPTRIEATIHNMAMKRLQDGQFDECELSLRELSLIEASMAKTLAAHYHGRVAYPKLTPIPKQQANRSAKSPESQNAKPQNNHKTENPEETREELQLEPDEQIPQQPEPDLPLEQDQSEPDKSEQTEQETD
ncbi:MAG: HDIG domain-containing protein [Phycisphaerae bacterium]|nr:HDIG domain-containing protein [Phycisphaerae bacterium]MDD5380606.1 HDIG domain-containing protein [Phycisphaerae bacterium]